MSFPLNRTANLAVFASGRGSNLQSIIHTFSNNQNLARVALIVSDKVDAGALQIASEQNIPGFSYPFPVRKKDPDGEGRKAFENAVQKQLKLYKIDLICLAGFMRIFSAEFNRKWQGRLLNIHPSLLPDFKGLNSQRQALESGVQESGCTVHFVDAGVDTGPIILQRKVSILASDTEASLSSRILEQEHLAYPEAIQKVLKGEVRFIDMEIAQ